MFRQRLLTLALFFAAALFCRFALSDAYDPPDGYYPSSPSTGSDLKTQLYTIISNPLTFKKRTYGDSRFAFELIDKDPLNANNILLDYNRASVDGTWDAGITFNREHVWPKHWLNLTSSQVDNSYSGVASDLFELRPTNPNINSSRGDYGYGATSVTVPHSYGVVNDANGTGSYWYPGDADRGDSARSIFYMATRYGQGQTNNLSLVNGQPALYQFGDLASLLKWHYEDTPDDFERRRNQYIYSSALNPTYYQGNRNPYIDHPEWVWSVYKNQTNDSQISIAGATVNPDGSSVKNVDLGRVFVGGALPAPEVNTLNKSGNDGTYYSVTTAGSATSTATGRFNAFRMVAGDTKSISIGLNTDSSSPGHIDTASPGLRTGTVTVDNLDITTLGGNGHGANDQNDTFNVSFNVLDHAKPSFATPSLTTSQTLDFGTIAIGGSSPTLTFDVFDLNSTVGSTANLDFDSVVPSGNISAFTTNLAASAGSLQIAAGSGHTFSTSLNLTSVGTFSATYTLNFSDENIVGAQNKSMTLTLTGAVRLPGDFDGDGLVDAGDYLLWRRTFGQTGLAAYSGADGDGNSIVDDADYGVWRANFGLSAGGSGSGQLFTAAVPEPATLWLLTIAAIVVCHCLQSKR